MIFQSHAVKKIFQNLRVRLSFSIRKAVKIKLFVALAIQYFELKIFFFSSYVSYVTRGFITSTRAFNLLTRAFNLPTRAFNLPTRAFNLATRGSELVTREFELVTPNSIMIKSLKSKKKKLAVTSFYYVSREIWLCNSKKLICIDQSRFYIFSQPREFKDV